jgi:hypothetical protein
MESSILGNVFLQYGWPGLIIFALISIFFIWLKHSMDKNAKKTSDTLSSGFTNLASDMAKHNDKLLDALLVQNQTNTKALLDVVNVALNKHEKQNKDVYNRNLKLRENASFKIKKKIHDLLNRYNCDRAFILEFHNSKQNMTGLSFLWYDMTFEEIAKGVPTINTYWKDQEASALLPVVKDISDEDGFEIYTIEDLEELQKTSTVLYHRLRIERQLQEAIMVGLYGSNNEIIGILILEYEESFIPVEILDVADILREAGSISDLLDYKKLETVDIVDNKHEE